jgi:hypothetical protein
VPEALSIELLDELEQRWRSQGAPVADQLQPGLSHAEMDALVAPLGLTLPDEPRVWWGWRNGARGADLGVPVGFSHDSLQHAVERAGFQRRIAREVADDDPSSMWRWSWLPWSYDISGAALVIEASDDAHVSPVSVHLIDDGSDIPVSAPSMGTLVRWWLELFDLGICAYDRGADRWRRDADALPPHYDHRLT